MKNKDSNLIYNQYSSINLNNYLPNQKATPLRSPSNNCNFNKLNPSFNGKVQHIQNMRKLSTPNYLNSRKINSSINLNKLNIQSNNQPKINNISTKYISSSILPFNSNNSNYFSPPPQKPSRLSDFPNLNSLKLNKKYISSPLLNMNKSKNIIKKKTLILDLDETLVHSGFNQFKRKSDIILNINVDGKNHTIYVLKRPFVDHFLKEVSKYFEIIIFTASIQQYASALLDKLDKEKLLFNGRLYRQNCIFSNGLYLKDIKQIGKNLEDMIIIDNNPASFIINEDNGIPILTWYDDLNDNELNKLIPLLKYLSNVDDVRPMIKQIVNKEKNEINFDLVDNIINNNDEKNNNYKKLINGGAKNIYDNFYYNKNNYNIRTYDNDININNMNGQENKFDYYLNNGINCINNNNSVYKYNYIINSLSNMTYDEIQNEGYINNNIKEINNNNYNNYDGINMNNNNKNTSILNRTKKLFSGINNNNEINEDVNKKNKVKFVCNKEKNNNIRSFTPNTNIQRKNNYFNRENLEINNKKNNINLIGNIQENINEINETLNNFNHRNSKDIVNNGINNKTKINNYLMKNDDDNNDIKHYYFQSSQNNILTKKKQLINNDKLYNINNGQENIKKSENNINNLIKNTNYNYLNNINNRNNNNNRTGVNYNSLGNNNLNKINNINQNSLKVNNYIIHSNNNINEINKKINNYNIINGLLKEKKEKNNTKSIIELRREKLNEIKRKMEEINKDIIRTENQFYHTQKDFMPKNDINRNYKMNFFKYNSHEILKNEFNYRENNKNNQIRKNHFIDKETLINSNNNINFTRSFSENKKFISNNEEYNSITANYINNEGINNNNNNIRTIDSNDDIDSLKNKNKKQRADTEITNKYNIDNIVNHVNKNKNTRSLIVSKKMNNYNNNTNDIFFNSTYNGSYNNNYVKNINIKNDYFKEIDQEQFTRDSTIKKNNFSLNRNYFENKENFSLNRNNINNININNINSYNSLINDNKVNINQKKIIINNMNNYNGQNKIIMNKSSSNFYPRISINSSEEEKKEENNSNTIRNFNLENGFKYNNNNDFLGKDKNKFVKKNSFNKLMVNNGLFRKKCLNNNYNFE